MNITRKLALSAMLATTLVAGAAQAAEPGFYLGAGAGQTTLKTDIEPRNSSGNKIEIDEDDTGWKAFLGYQFVPWLGVEAGYVELGRGDDSRTFANGGDIEAEVDVGGVEYYLVPSLPLGEHFEIFGKIGGFYGDISADGKLRRSAGAPREKFDESSDEESMLAYGGGLAWNFGRGHWSLRAEYIQYDADDLDDLYQVSGSLVYRFFSDRAPAVAAAPVVEAAPAACADADSDGVCDSEDQCPNTPANTAVDAIGCTCHYNLNLEFAFDSAELSVNDMVQLDAIVPILTNPKAKFIGGTIDGHTDSIGSEAYNLGLSQRRADAVKAYLESKGANLAGRFTATGFGESKPIASNDTEEGRAQNRRVELRRTDCDHSK
jgi:outer membrane protein OmpA-like peptidoglycan-associated protein